MIEHFIKLRNQIGELKKQSRNELRKLESTGNAKFQQWSDKYGSYSTWLVSDDAALLADAEIDGWINTSCNPIVLRSTGEELTSWDTRIIRIDLDEI